MVTLYLLKLKLFDVLLSIDIIVLVRRLFTETMMSIDYKMPNSLSLNVYQLGSHLPHCTQKSRNMLFQITTFSILCLISQSLNYLGHVYFNIIVTLLVLISTQSGFWLLKTCTLFQLTTCLPARCQCLNQQILNSQSIVTPSWLRLCERRLD